MAQLYSSAKKRDLPNYQSQQRYTQPPPGLQNTRDNWNPKVWEWNSVRFVAKPKEAEELLRLDTPTPTHIHIPIPNIQTTATTIDRGFKLEKGISGFMKK